MTYEPIFKGEWPTAAADRWALIRRFLSDWCFGNPNHFQERREPSARLISEFRQRRKDSIPLSLHHWFDVVENHSGDELFIRDVSEVSDLSSHLEVPAGEFTVVLMQGEGDVFWAVRNDLLGDDDPQVFAFQNYAPESPPLLGFYPSVSSFALWYILLYNNHGKRQVDAFSYDFSKEDYDVICDWFPDRLVVQPVNPFCSCMEIFEAPDCVGIRVRDRLTCSLFSDHRQLALPAVLQGALNEEHQRCKELRKMLSRNSDDGNTT